MVKTEQIERVDQRVREEVEVLKRAQDGEIQD